MGEIISTIKTGTDKYYDFSRNKTKKESTIRQKDPNKICMTHTIVPNKREIEKKDINKFIDKINNKPIKNVKIVEKAKKKVEKPIETPKQNKKGRRSKIEVSEDKKEK